jgi:hypothetical protein
MTGGEPSFHRVTSLRVTTAGKNCEPFVFLYRTRVPGKLAEVCTVFLPRSIKLFEQSRAWVRLRSRGYRKLGILKLLMDGFVQVALPDSGAGGRNGT